MPSLQFVPNAFTPWAAPAFTPHAVGQWYINGLCPQTRTSVPTQDALRVYPAYSGPDGCTVSDLGISVNTVGTATCVTRVGLWVVRDQARPFKWAAGTVWADLLLDGGTIATDSGTGTKTKDITDTAILPNTWFAVGAADQIATAATRVVEGAAGAAWHSPLGQSGSPGIGGAPNISLSQNSVTGAFGATFTPNGATNIGPGVGYLRSV